MARRAGLPAPLVVVVVSVLVLLLGSLALDEVAAAAEDEDIGAGAARRPLWRGCCNQYREGGEPGRSYSGRTIGPCIPTQPCPIPIVP
uniref:Uncharacterized protein n=1 Tax=Oryza punctata TaxID=4537 RepID=A0A0E0MKS1_ORYPU